MIDPTRPVMTAEGEHVEVAYYDDTFIFGYIGNKMKAPRVYALRDGREYFDNRCTIINTPRKVTRWVCFQRDPDPYGDGAIATIHDRPPFPKGFFSIEKVEAELPE